MEERENRSASETPNAFGAVNPVSTSRICWWSEQARRGIIRVHAGDAGGQPNEPKTSATPEKECNHDCSKQQKGIDERAKLSFF
jgi:hypothetical protein